MTVAVMAAGLAIVSVLAGLVTEAVKKICENRDSDCPENLTAGCASVVLAVVYGAAVSVAGGGWTAQSIVCTIVLAILSWLCSMLGYDKVTQTIAQLAERIKAQDEAVKACAGEETADSAGQEDGTETEDGDEAEAGAADSTEPEGTDSAEAEDADSTETGSTDSSEAEDADTAGSGGTEEDSPEEGSPETSEDDKEAE